MAIDLLHSFTGKGSGITEGRKSESPTVAARSQGNLQIARAIRALKAGQTIQGEIIAVKGKEVQLSVMNQMVVDARLEQSMNLLPGTTMAFQIKSNNTDTGLSLLPLFMNTAVDPNAMKALDMAGIPLTDRTLEMVQNLMERGLPIDKQALQETYRDLTAFKDARVSDIISLRQMNLPVTAENLQQMEAYSNNRHLLSNTFSEIGAEIGKQLAQWIGDKNPTQVRTFLEQLQVIVRSAVSLKGALEGQTTTMTGQAVGNPVTEGALPAPDPMVKPEVMAGKPGELPLQEELLQDASIRENPEAVIKAGPEITGKPEEAVPKTVITEEGIPTKQGSSANTAVDQLLNTLLRTSRPEKIQKAFESFWDKEIKPALLMEPEQVMEKEKVQKYYESLSRKMGQLEALAEKMTGSQSSLTKSVQNTTSNLDFMNQLNQLHAYVQLPIKLSDREAKGELYVFTNKRSLAKQDGKVTALLHLDMEYLGKMDVYVALEESKVSTQFYMEKEEHLDFLNAHMDLLTSRLNKRGYDCTVQTCLRKEEETAVIEQIASDQNQSFLLSTQSFDMRA